MAAQVEVFPVQAQSWEQALTVRGGKEWMFLKAIVSSNFCTLMALPLQGCADQLFFVSLIQTGVSGKGEP